MHTYIDIYLLYTIQPRAGGRGIGSSTELNLIYDKFTMIYALRAHIFSRCPSSKPIKRATAKKKEERKRKAKNRISHFALFHFDTLPAKCG